MTLLGVFSLRSMSLNFTFFSIRLFLNLAIFIGLTTFLNSIIVSYENSSKNFHFSLFPCFSLFFRFLDFQISLNIWLLFVAVRIFSINRIPKGVWKIPDFSGFSTFFGSTVFLLPIIQFLSIFLFSWILLF